MNQQLYGQALRLLARRAHGTEELRGKLARRASDEEVSEVLARLESNRLLHDGDFAYLRAESRRRRMWGNRRIERDLKRLGLDATIVRLTLDRLDREYPEAEALGRAVRCWIRRHGAPANASQLKRLFDHCLRLGYRAEAVREELSDYFGTVAW